MSKSKNTKRALIASVMSFILCFTMLIGTTFAWFTDNASTGVNKIQAGNLDIELEYSKDMTTWIKADDKTDIFDANALWEPGYAQIVYFRITNNGNLALKYQFGINLINNILGKTADDTEIDLTKYIKFGITENVAAAYGSRKDAIDAVKDKAMDFNKYSVSDKSLQKGASDTLAMVVYMPETVGNEANHGPDEGDVPYIEFGVSVLATQKDQEKDSFGSDYDINAAYPVVFDITVANGGTITSGNAQITVPANAVDQDVTAIFSMQMIESTLDSVTYEISLKEQNGGSIQLNQDATVTATIDRNLKNVEVYHSGTLMDSKKYTYEPSTGKLTIMASSFSPFKITYDINTAEVVTKEQLQNKLNEFTDSNAGNGVINITEDITLQEGETWTPVEVQGYTGAGIIEINGNGHTISGLTAPLFAGGFAGSSGIIINELTIADSNIVSTNSTGSGAFIEAIDSMQKITLNKCHLKDSTVNGSRTGGLIGWNSGYNNENDGPVNTQVLIENCSVVGCTITGNGTVGGIIGHAGANPATWNTIRNCTVTDCTLTSNDDSYRVGVVVGTANVGHVDISNITNERNTLTQNNNGTEIARPEGQSDLYGRTVFGGTGTLTIDGSVVQ